MRIETQKKKNSITNTTKDRLPRLPFFDIKKAILGEKYELSIVFNGNALSRKLNKKYKKRDNPANVLCFRLGTHAGEIFINRTRAQKEARMYQESVRNRVGFLFIHGLLHLKGYTHSSTMSKEEVKMRQRFQIM